MASFINLPVVLKSSVAGRNASCRRCTKVPKPVVAAFIAGSNRWLVSLVLLLGLATARASVLTWDSNKGAAGSDGAGSWVTGTTTASYWYNGSAAVTWTDGSDASIGSGGTPGQISLKASVTVGNITFNQTSSSGYSVSGANTITFIGGTVTVNNTPGPTEFIKTIFAGSVGFTKAGSGTLILTGTTGNYTGATHVTVGLLQLLGADNGLATSQTLQVDSTATFDLNGRNQTVDGLTGTGTINNSTASSRTLTIGSAGGSGEFDGVIESTGAAADLSLVKAGSGTEILGGASTYTGITTVSAGTLLVNGSIAGAVTNASGATFGGYGGTVGGKVTYASGALALFTNGAPLTISGALVLSGNTVNLNLPANLASGTYTLATYNTTGSSGSFATTPNVLSGSFASGGIGTISTVGGTVTLNVTGCQANITSSPPANTMACIGGTASFTVGATGSSLTYDWQVNTGSGFADVTTGTGQGTPVYTTPTLTGSETGYQYRCIVTATCGSPQTSSVSTLTVQSSSLYWFPTGQSSNLVWLKGGHASKVEGVAWSPDGSVLASASDDATVKLWSTNGTLLRTLVTHPYQATALAFSPDGTKLAVGVYAGGYYISSNGLGRVILWQATSGNANVLFTLTNKFGRITAVAFSTDGTMLASCTSGGSNYVNRVSDGTLLTSMSVYTTNQLISQETNAAALSLAFSAGGFLASGCEDDTISIWNTSSWTQVWTNNTAHSSNVTAVAFSPNGSVLATASLDQTIQLWAATNWTSLGSLLGHTNGITSVSFSPDGSRLASGSTDGSIKLWNVAGQTCIATIPAHSDSVMSVAISPDGTRLASGGADNSVKLWSALDGTFIQQLGYHTDMIKAIAVSPDGTLCATASNDQSIELRQLADGLLLRTIAGQTGCVSSIAFSADSTLLASGGGPLDPTIKLWRVSDGTLLNTIAATTNGVMALAFSPDGSKLASGGDYSEQVIQLWSPTNALTWSATNAQSVTNVLTLPGHTNGVTALAFSLDGNLLASGGRRSNYSNTDNTVKVWAVTNGGSLIQAFTCYTNNTESVAFSPDGSTVAAGSSCSSITNNSSATNLLTLWKISDGSSRIFGSDTNPVFFVSFSPDGGTLASASTNSIKLWNVNSGVLSQTINQETFRVSCLAYLTNGNFFAYGREDATLALNHLGTVPAFLTQPASRTNAVGSMASFSVTAFAPSSFSYQWCRNGTNLVNGGDISGVNTNTLMLSNVQAGDAANYTVVIMNTSGSVTSSIASLTINNQSPVANTVNYTRSNDTVLTINIANLLTNDTDPDGYYPLVLTAVGVSTNGVTVTTNSTDIFYTNANNVADSFSYTISDTSGATATGTIQIQMVPTVVTNSLISLQVGVPGCNSNTLVFAGVASCQYVVQFATNLNTSPWFNLCTNYTDTNGLWQIIDPTATDEQRFYRVKKCN